MGSGQGGVGWVEGERSGVLLSRQLLDVKSFSCERYRVFQVLGGLFAE